MYQFKIRFLHFVADKIAHLIIAYTWPVPNPTGPIAQLFKRAHIVFALYKPVFLGHSILTFIVRRLSIYDNLATGSAHHRTAA